MSKTHEGGPVDSITCMFDDVRHGDIKGLIQEHSTYLMAALAIGVAGYMLTNAVSGNAATLLKYGAGGAGALGLGKYLGIWDKVKELFEGMGIESPALTNE